MHIDRLQLLKILVFLAAAASCASSNAQENVADVYSDLSQTEVDTIETERPVSLNSPESANRDVVYGSTLTADGRLEMSFND